MLELSGSIAYLDTEDEATGEPLLGRAELMGRGALALSPGATTFRAEVVRSGRVPVSRTATSTTYQESVTRLNLAGALSLGGVRLTAGVDNLTDDRPANAIMELRRRWFVGASAGVAW
jgi:outer membrane receptor protein involved in Fe transport